MAEAAPAEPMSGLRVLDHGHVWAGPLLASMFADMGAEVIKVQAPARESGIAMAGSRPSSLGSAEGAARRDDPTSYHGWDRGKLNVTLELTEERGRALYFRLLRVSDVVIENFAPRVMPALGLGYETLAAVNPRLIMIAMSAAGATPGPWRDLLTYGPSLAALYGIKSVLGYHDDPRPREDPADLDPMAAVHGFVAIAAALEYRERSGRGQFIDLAQGEAALQRIAEPLLDNLLNDRVAAPQGNRYPGLAPHGIYRAAGDDRWISIVVRDDREWRALIEVAGADGAHGAGLATPDFASAPLRLRRQDALDEAIERWTTQHDAMELSEALQEVGVPAFPVMDVPGLVADAGYTAIRTAHVRITAETSLAIDQIYQGIPWKLTETPGVIQGPVARAGEHNEYVYGDLLGLETSARRELADAGII